MNLNFSKKVHLWGRGSIAPDNSSHYPIEVTGQSVLFPKRDFITGDFL